MSPRFQHNIELVEPGGLFYQNFQIFRIPPSSPHAVESLCMIHHIVYYQLLDKFPNFPEPIASNEAKRCYRIYPVENQGLGMFATRDIEPGEIIVSERPVLLLPGGIPYLRFQNNPITVLWDRLRKEQASLLEGLFNCWPLSQSSKSPTTDIRKGIIDTNALGLEFFPEPGLDDTYAGIFPEIARCNHRYVQPTNHYPRY